MVGQTPLEEATAPPYKGGGLKNDQPRILPTLNSEEAKNYCQFNKGVGSLCFIDF